jgi:trk system potassium uptake protein TrkH
MRAEVPGPKFGKLAPKMRTSSAISYMIYIALTVILIVLLLAGGMSFFDSINHAFATAATGGFSVKALSIGQYNNLYFEIVLGIFMLLFATNFSFFFLILARKFKNAFKISEVWVFYAIVTFAVITISLDIQDLYGGFFGGLRHAFFQVSSIISTTGFSSTDFALWPSYSRLVLLAVMIIGACASSTGGGLKVIRIMVLVKASLLESLKALSPRSTVKVKVGGEVVDKQSVYLIFVYFFIYIAVIGIATVAVSLNGFDIESSVSAAITCIGNTGPALAKFGPMENFMALSGFTKLILSMAMLIGRLEIFPIFIIFMPETWRKA